MKSNKLFKLLSLVVMLFVAIPSNAQSDADKLFLAGQELQKVMKVNSQRQAIKKFQSARAIYATAEKKTMCDNQIAICNKNIKSITPAPTSKTSTKTETKKFELSQDLVEFDGERMGSANVVVEASTMEWNFEVTDNGTESFAKVTRSSDAKSIDIVVEANTKTIGREQIVNVNYGNDKKAITIRQDGKLVTLSTSKNVLEFPLKGGKKAIEIYTNSDSIVASNNDLTWYVESKPDWVEINVEVKKKKGLLDKVASTAKNIVAGSAAAASAEDVKTSEVNVVVTPLLKNDPGRKGEVIFASQDKRYKIIVMQQ